MQARSLTSVVVPFSYRVKGVNMTGTELMKAIIKRDSLSPTKLSVDMGRSRGYLSTLIALDRDCQLQTLLEFCGATNYEIVVRSRADGFEFLL